MAGPHEGPVELVERLLAEPPAVHAMDFSADPPLGVWSTDADCYRFLAHRCAPGSRTLETGSGLSTLLFAAMGATHTCVTPLQTEIERLRKHASSLDIDLSRVRFVIGGSEEVLPALEPDPLDLVLIDGNHGHPTPTLDWFHGARRLVNGGIVVVDDLQLPAPAMLARMLDRDPRWARTAGTAKWGAWARQGEGPLSQDWFDQPWLAHPDREGVAGRVRQARSFIGRHLRRSAG